MSSSKFLTYTQSKFCPDHGAGWTWPSRYFLCHCAIPVWEHRIWCEEAKLLLKMELL